VIWLLSRPVVWPAKAGAVGAKAGYRTGRMLGYRRLSVLVIGIAIGLLLAPVPGRELRAKVRELLDRGPLGELPPVGGTSTSVLDLDDDIDIRP
jgi:hypothetical protein